MFKETQLKFETAVDKWLATIKFYETDYAKVRDSLTPKNAQLLDTELESFKAKLSAVITILESLQ